VATPEFNSSPCRHFPICGGCSFLHRPYYEELSEKERHVRELLGPLGIRVAPIVGSPVSVGWRHKVQLPFAFRMEGKRQIATLGCFARESHQVIDQMECRIQDPALTRLGMAVRDWANRERIPIYDERSGQGFLRHVLMRKAQGTGEILLGLVTNGPRPTHYRALLKTLLQATSKALPGEDGQLVGVVQNINERSTNVVLGEVEQPWWGRDWIKEKLGKHTYHIELSTFFQINPFQTPRLYEEVRKGIREGSRVLDAYCGLGTIGMWVADRCSEVLGLEENPRSVQAGRAAAKANGVTNMHFVRADASERLAGLVREGWDCLVVDPPRKGLEEAGADAIESSGIPRLVYVSCDPRSLARDIERLSRSYRTVSAVPVDMFPRTTHVETVAVLESLRR